MMRPLTMVAAVLAAATAALSAGAQEDVMAHYDAYNAALAEGRFDDAIREGEAAWRAAEAEWGDAPETGVLAYNLADLRARRGRFSEAYDPAARALELAESGVAPDVGALDAALILGLAEIENGDDRGGAQRLEQVLPARLEAGLENDELATIGWYRLAAEQAERRRWSEAQAAGAQARVAAVSLGDEWRDIATGAALFEGASAIAGDHFDEALRAFEAGLDTFPDTQCVIEEPRIAELMTWRAAAEMVAASDWSARREQRRLRHRDHPPKDDSAAPEEPETEDEEPDICDPLWDTDWLRRDPPQYPSREMERGRVGAVMVAYDLTSTGETENVRVLAAVPNDERGQFDDASIEAVRRWRKEVPEGTPDYCFRDLNVIMQFSLEP